MKSYKNLYDRLCSYENLELAFRKARKRKTLKDYVIEFESNIEENLLELQFELQTLSYKPSPLTIFTVNDPKTRRISASHFRDRVVHHAICNVIEPIFENCFIHDSFANQKGKGTHNAIKKFEKFLRQVSFSHQKIKMGGGEALLNNNAVVGYVLKADIKHYFENINHQILLKQARRKIKDEKVLWLIELILKNHKTDIVGKGLPLGNLTSQFFANVYLSEFDHFVKEQIRAKYYIRYVDDFVVLHISKNTLLDWKKQFDEFLKNRLHVELHPEKSKIIPLKGGITMLGFRIFPKYRLLKKSNARRIWKRLERFKQKYENREIERSKIVESLEGWLAYAEFANTYKFRKRVVGKFNEYFSETV